MTKAEIEKLIDYIDEHVPNVTFDERYHDGEKMVEKGLQIYCKVDYLLDALRNYPVEEEKTCGPDWEAMYKRNAEELDKAQIELQRMQRAMDKLSIAHAQYVGAVAAMETIFGRKFEPNR